MMKIIATTFLIVFFPLSAQLQEKTTVSIKVRNDRTRVTFEVILLLEKPEMKFSLPKVTNYILPGTGLSGDIYGKTGVISKLIIGPYELTNIKAAFADTKVRSKQGHADAVLGNGAFMQFNSIFDYANRKLYLQPNSHFNRADR